MSRAVCRFWQQGNCRNGNNCRFEHPGASGQQSSNNRYGPLAGGSSGGNRSGEMPYLLSKEGLEKDLTEPERPKWILSAYGPGKDAPEQLFGGYPIEQSFEEIRLHYIQGELSGNPQGALTEIEGLYNQAQQKIQNALGNLDAALQFVVASENKHPNRIDICQQNSRPGGTTGEFAVGRQISTGSSAFGSPFSSQQSQSTPSPFGQPSALGQRVSPFGTSAAVPASTSAFGQPSQLGAPSAFGKPSQLGGTSAFGQPSQMGTGASAFGQPSQLGSTSTGFGQPSALGAKPSPFGATGFGQPSQPSQTASGFGQPSQPSQATSGFGQPSQPSQANSGFGQPSSLGQKPSPFGSGGAAGPSPFGVPSSSAPGNPFGQPTQTQAPSPFGQPAQTQSPSPFGQPGPQNPGAFSTPSAITAQNSNGPFSQPQSTNAFGQPAQPSSQPTPFGVPSNNAGSNAFSGSAGPSPFGVPGNGNAFQQPAQQATSFGGAGGGGGIAAPGQSQAQGPYGPGASRQHPTIESYSAKGPDGRLRMFKGKQVDYRLLKGEEKPVPVSVSFNGSIIRIWHPDGAPPFNPDTEAADPSAYDDKVLQQWRGFVETGKFVDGLIPEVPPKREFCAWDF